MRASIIIACHNEGSRLWKTVQSCVDTSAGIDHEILVADDASCDDSVAEARRRFSHIRIVAHDERRGASPTKALGARHARGDVLVFLDGHCKPEHQAIARLIEDVELLEGAAIVTPEIPALDTEHWTNNCCQSGNGYRMDLERFGCNWVDLSQLSSVQERGRTFYESPALIGCALAVSRKTYDALHGFDPRMFKWGVEDLEFGLKAWLLGYRVLHDPQAVIGHRFRSTFDNFSAPIEHILVNQLRTARAHFSESIWQQWVERCRQRTTTGLATHPEGLWARAWELFQAERASVEQERAFLLGRRAHDEFWYAERFGLDWPRLPDGAGMSASRTRNPRCPGDPSSGPSSGPCLDAILDGDPSPSPAPKKCKLTSISADSPKGCVNQPKTFTAAGENLNNVQWTAIGAKPYYGTGATFTTQWPTGGTKEVSARCGGVTKSLTVTITQLDSITPTQQAACVNKPVSFTATGTNPGNVSWSTSPAGFPSTGQGSKFSTQWADVGEKQVSASCGPTVKSATVDVVDIQFGDDLIKTGFTFPASQSQLAANSFLSAQPAEAVNDIELETDSNRVRIEIIERIPEGGILAFRVYGRAASKDPAGDVTIKARYKDQVVCAQTKAIVVVPKFVGNPHDQTSGPVTPENMNVTNSTSPAWFDPLGNKVVLATLYRQILTIQVVDQFQNPLDALYAGAPVVEQSGGKFKPINQNLDGSGTYQDPVGVFSFKNGSSAKSIVFNQSKAAKDWPNADPAPIDTTALKSQTILVKVAGHQLKVGIVNRQVTPVAPNIINISWPDTPLGN
jgi:GT2 family glycosyltransferase